MLYFSPRLSYRDVMHLLVLTCRGDLPEFEQGGNYFMKNAANLSGWYKLISYKLLCYLVSGVDFSH